MHVQGRVSLIASTMVDWPLFISSVLAISGRSPTRKLDERARPIDHLAAYLAALSCLKDETSDPILAIKKANATLEHISFTFVIEVDHKNALHIVEMHSGIIVTVAQEDLIICTATLGIWRAAILESCKLTFSKTIRIIFNQIYFILKQNELGYIFPDINIKKHTDGTFLLSE